MCTRSGRHASASVTSNSTSRRAPSEQYNSRRNPASRAIPRSAPSSSSSSCQDIMKATATALELQVSSHEPEDHQAVAVSCHHDTPGNTSNSGRPAQQGLNNKFRARADRTAGLAPLPDPAPYPRGLRVSRGSSAARIGAPAAAGGGGGGALGSALGLSSARPGPPPG